MSLFEEENITTRIGRIDAPLERCLAFIEEREGSDDIGMENM